MIQLKRFQTSPKIPKSLKRVKNSNLRTKSLKVKHCSQVNYRIQISNLQTLPIIMSQSYSCVAKRNNTLYCNGNNHT